MSDAGIIAIVTGAVTVSTTLVTFLTLWIKLKYGADKAQEAAEKAAVVEEKIDNNTRITENGVAKAANNAHAAAVAATNVSATADAINRKLNGGIDSAIQNAVTPIGDALAQHIKQDAEDLEEVKRMLRDFVTDSKLKEFSDYVHERNHDMLNAMQAQTNMMSVVLKKLDGGQK